MKEGVKYTLNPPNLEDLNPEDNYLIEFDKWSHFKLVLGEIAEQAGIPIEKAILREDLYQEAVDYTYIDGDEDYMFA